MQCVDNYLNPRNCRVTRPPGRKSKEAVCSPVYDTIFCTRDLRSIRSTANSLLQLFRWPFNNRVACFQEGNVHVLAQVLKHRYLPLYPNMDRSNPGKFQVQWKSHSCLSCVNLPLNSKFPSFKSILFFSFLELSWRHLYGFRFCINCVFLPVFILPLSTARPCWIIATIFNKRWGQGLHLSTKQGRTFSTFLKKNPKSGVAWSFLVKRHGCLSEQYRGAWTME